MIDPNFNALIRNFVRLETPTARPDSPAEQESVALDELFQNVAKLRLATPSSSDSADVSF